MNKQIFILNGTAGAGKDTFANMLNEYIPTKHISSITPVKEVAKVLGWSGDKTPEYRSFLCDTKKYLNSKGDFIWNYLDAQVEDFRKDDKTKVLLIDIQEPDEIKKAVERYGAETILIVRPSVVKVKNVFNRLGKKIGEYDQYITEKNSADMNVGNYHYDWYFNNSGTLEELKESIGIFANNISPNPFSEHSSDFNKVVIAVDFDNTIAKTEYPKIIAPIPETIEFLRKAKANGAEIILNTCREEKELQEALDWCKENNVPIDRANENSPTRIKLWGNDCRKIGADLYIDDKACSLWHDRRDWSDLLGSMFDLIEF